MTTVHDRQHTLIFLNADVVGYSRLLSDYLEATTEIIKARFSAVDVAAWLDKNPCHIKALVERWKQDLASAGAIQPS